MQTFTREHIIFDGNLHVLFQGKGIETGIFFGNPYGFIWDSIMIYGGIHDDSREGPGGKRTSMLYIYIYE